MAMAYLTPQYIQTGFVLKGSRVHDPRMFDHFDPYFWCSIGYLDYNPGDNLLEHPENYALLTHPVCTEYTQ